MQTTDILIEPSQLSAALAKGAILIDARKAGEFKNGHIPGARPLTTYDVFVPNTSLEGLKAFAEAMASRYSSVGVVSERPVIVYDNETGDRAARELWILEFLGHTHARMLHGGLKQWAAEGGPVLDDTDIATVRPRKLAISMVTSCLASADEVNRRAGSWNFGLIDVRSDLEWNGKDSTACCKRRGHIPHAVHIEWTQFLRNGRYKSPQEILDLIKQHDINPLHDIVPYCHRGARSANTYYALRYAGALSARNFIGSWHEWSAREELPIETGVLPK